MPISYFQSQDLDDETIGVWLDVLNFIEAVEKHTPYRLVRPGPGGSWDLRSQTPNPVS